MMGPVGGERIVSAAGQAFFARLPPHSLMPEEDAVLRLLRQLAAATSFLPRCISFQEWADRRVPAELAHEVNASGLVYIRPPGQHEVPGKQPLLASPQPHSLLQGHSAKPVFAKMPQPPPKAPPKTLQVQAQVQLPRQALPPKSAASGAAAAALQRFLASLPTDALSQEEEELRQSILWNSRRKGLNSIEKMRNNHYVKAAYENFLPSDVQLEDWIVHRIGGEVDIDEHGTVTMCVKPPKGERARLTAEATEAFFASLPEDEFTEDELALRSEITEVTSTWRKDAPLTVSLLAQEPRVFAARRQLLPELVGFKAWLERRLGSEVQLRPLPNDQLAVVSAKEADGGGGGGHAPGQQWSHKRQRVA